MAKSFASWVDVLGAHFGSRVNDKFPAVVSIVIVFGAVKIGPSLLASKTATESKAPVAGAAAGVAAAGVAVAFGVFTPQNWPWSLLNTQSGRAKLLSSKNMPMVAIESSG